MKRRNVILVVIVVMAPMAAGWLAAGQLAHPSRRPLQDYHREFLADPAAHGVVLKSFECADGTPSLLCEPMPGGVLGKRGRVVREQLMQKKVKLPAAGGIIGNVVLVHGRRGRKEDYLLIAERFCAVGFRCILFDLPAHGDNPGDTACYGVREARLPAAVLKEAVAKFGFAEQPAGIMGISMGGAVSIRSAAAPDAPWKAAIFVSTFDTLEHVVSYQASQIAGEWPGSVWSRITGWFYRQKTGVDIGDINSIALVPEIRWPVMVAHGTADHVVPAECGRRLYAALSAGIEKRWVEIPGADHDNVLITDFPIYAEMAEWLLRHVPES